MEKTMDFDLDKPTSSDSLCHYGVLGMKWGVRRYQNKDGTLTSAGKNKHKQGQDKKQISSEAKKKAILAVAGTMTLAAAAYYVHKNPEKIGKVIAKVKDVKVSDISQKTKDVGKKYVKSIISGTKEGIDEAMKEAPKKAAKAVVTGIIMNQTKKVLDSTVGKEESAKIFQANDNKKIGKFWKVSDEDKDDD